MLEGPQGRLLFAVPPKSDNAHSRIDVDSRSAARRIVTDSDIPLHHGLDETGLRSLADGMLEA